jgi:hypothetical protein
MKAVDLELEKKKIGLPSGQSMGKRCLKLNVWFWIQLYGNRSQIIGSFHIILN